MKAYNNLNTIEFPLNRLCIKICIEQTMTTCIRPPQNSNDIARAHPQDFEVQIGLRIFSDIFGRFLGMLLGHAWEAFGVICRSVWVASWEFFRCKTMYQKTRRLEYFWTVSGLSWKFQNSFVGCFRTNNTQNQHINNLQNVSKHIVLSNQHDFLLELQ